jgi:hypothetical protein
MKFISLASLHTGYACGIADYLNKYIYNYKKGPDFFDYITVSMKSINEILWYKKIEFENENLAKFMIPNPSDHVFVKFKNFDSMISYHDITEKCVNDNPNEICSNECNIVNNDAIKKMVNKYEKMKYCFIYDIMNEDKIFFIRFAIESADVAEDQIYDFFKNVSLINPNLKYYFILFIDSEVTISNELLNHPNFKVFEFRKYLIPGKKYDHNIYFRLLNDYDFTNFSKFIDSL